jgi:hypothetical protein
MKRRSSIATLRRVAVVGVVLSACLWGSTAAAAKVPAVRGTVIVYGDSLTSQSRYQIKARIADRRPGWRVVIQAQGGSAICDWLPFMKKDKALDPRVVVMQFSGNIQTSCIRERVSTEGSSWERSYADDAAAAARMWVDRGARVVIMGNPMPYTTPTLTRGPHPLDAVYQSIARSEKRVTFSDQPERAVAVPDPADRARFVFPFTMPCLPAEVSLTECSRGHIQVRDPGGGHFCPVVDPDGLACPTYSSGIVRFGDAVADAAVTRMAP